jgi:iron complex transport system ATP-binding protein
MEITVQNLSFSYGKRRVLAGITLAVREGEVLGLVGPNGSGKTTLLKTISGVLTPQAGAVYLDGRPIARLACREIARRVACVEQDREVGFDFTVEEIVAMGRFPHRRRLGQETKADREAIRRAMVETRVDSLARQSIRTISGGERQRTFLAMALAQEPRLLLLDEPTTHLDLRHQAEFMALVREGAQGGLSVIMALHDLTLAAAYSDEVALLSLGLLLASGRPEEVFTPANVHAAFGAEVVVGRNPSTGSLVVHSAPPR